MQRVFRVDLNKISKESKEILMLVSQQIDEMRQPGFTPEQFGNNRLFIDK